LHLENVSQKIEKKMFLKFSNWTDKKTYSSHCSFICFQNNSVNRWLLNRG
jgi:hypothetical protein